MHRRPFARHGFGAVAVCLAIGLAYIPRSPHFSATLLPWRCVGGCGTSAGGAGNTGAGVRWIGQGVTGTLVDIELQNSLTIMSNPRDSLMPHKNTFLILPSLYLHLRPIDIQICLPVAYKYAAIEKTIDQKSIINSGIGDLSADISLKVGTEGHIVPHLGFSIPTGRADGYNRFEVLPSDMQRGTGRFGGWIGLDYTISRDWGSIYISPGYTGGLFYAKTVDWHFDRTLSRGVPEKKSLVWARIVDKSDTAFLCGARNDLGVVTADRIILAGYAAIKQRRVTHGFGVSLGISTGDNAYDDFNYDNWLKDKTEKIVDTTGCTERETAQRIAEESTTFTFDATGQMVVIPRYSNPTVVGRDSIFWKVRESTRTIVKNYPVLAVQYSAELAQLCRVPLFVGMVLPLSLGGGHVFSGVSASIGARFGL
jgi:hypothetical protein